MTGFTDAAVFFRDAIWRACWQGGIALAVVYAICRIASGLSPSTKCWLWRIAYLKLLLALFWATPIDLPILRGPKPNSRAIHSPSNPSRILSSEGTSTNEILGSSPIVQEGQVKGQPQFPWILALWALGAAWCVGRIVRDIRLGRRLLDQCHPTADPRLIEQLNSLSAKLGLTGSPRLLMSGKGHGPLIIGANDPSIVLPESLPSTDSTNGINFVLAHEIAHIKRADLKWNRLPALSHVLFYFHPLAILANREWRLSQEMACDELAMRACGNDNAEYAAALMQFASTGQRPARSFAAAGFDDSPSDLKRRLKAMHHYSTVPGRRTALGVMFVSVVGAAILIPWRVVAQTPHTPTTQLAQATASGKGQSSEQKAMLERLRKLEARVAELQSRLAQERSRTSADRKRDVELLKRAREQEKYAAEMDRASRDMQIHAERARIEALMQRDRGAHEEKVARARADEAEALAKARADQDAAANAERSALDQLAAERDRQAAEQKRADDLMKKGFMSQGQHEELIRRHEQEMLRMRADMEKLHSAHERDQQRALQEHQRLLEMERAKMDRGVAEMHRAHADQNRQRALLEMQKRYTDAEVARMKDIIKRQEEQIRALEQRNKAIQDKQKKNPDQALLQYRIAESDNRLAELRTKYAEGHPLIRQALYEQEFLSQLKRSSQAHDNSVRTAALKQDLERKLLDLDQNLAQLNTELGDQHPRVKGLHAQREVIMKQMEMLEKGKN